MIKKLSILLVLLLNTNFLISINFDKFYEEFIKFDAIRFNEDALEFLKGLVEDSIDGGVKTDLAQYVFDLPAGKLALRPNLVYPDGTLTSVEATAENIPPAIKQVFIIANLALFIIIDLELEREILDLLFQSLPERIASGSLNQSRLSFDNACKSIIDAQADEQPDSPPIDLKSHGSLHMDLGRKGKDRRCKRVALSFPDERSSLLDRPADGTSPGFYGRPRKPDRQIRTL